LSEDGPNFWESLVAGLTMTKEDWTAIKTLIIIIMLILASAFFL